MAVGAMLLRSPRTCRPASERRRVQHRKTVVGLRLSDSPRLVHYFLPFIIAGLVTGAVYGLAGIGLVLTYKTSGIFNFGYGSIAALNVFVFYFFNTEHKMAWPLAALISVGIFAPLLGLALEFFARTLEGASETIKVVSTVGLILIVEAIGMLWHSAGALLHQLPVPVNGEAARSERHMGADHRVLVLRRGLGGLVLVLPHRAPRGAHAGCGGQPRAGLHER